MYIDLIYTFYIALLTSAVLLETFVRQTLSRQIKAFIIFVLATITILLSGLRFETGSDWFPYLEHFESSSDSFEPGYMIINDVLKNLTSNYTVFLLIIALPIYFIVPISKLNVKHQTFIFCGIIFQYFPVFLGGNRQMIAILLTILSVNNFIVKQKLTFKAIIYALLATTFHASAIIILFSNVFISISIFLFNFIKKILRNKIMTNSKIITMIVAVLGFICLRFGLFILAGLLTKVLPFGNIEANLSTTNEVIGLDENQAKDIPILIERLLLSVFTFFRWRYLSKDWLSRYTVYMSVIYTVIFISYSDSFRIIAGRLSLYFRFADVLLYMLIALSFKGKLYQILLLCFTLIMAFRLFLSLHLNYYFLPYQFAL
ncbi:MAG: EpsG family protein [Methylacidiphilales bacterium]|nr:EpsG family protein [Candidatus Methylacidiphilales bacterium]NJR17579.1 EpsG family protein [Calothrix sp. CSU_2_0]